ncbi:FAD-binding protein [Streptomyces sp. NPDC006463]|uniref:FAD-binding protein n=1 Tax=Streptomyces sp. NPDC006463 TaxID=3364746 RepID=UPI0036BCD051
MSEYVDAVSPFPSLHQLGDEITDPVGDEFRALLGELYDDEFDLALWGLVQEGEGHLRQIVPGPAEEAGAYGPDQVRAERLLRTWAAPLQESADDLLERMAAALEAEDPALADEHRVEELLESVPATVTDMSAAFDEFLGSLNAPRALPARASADRTALVQGGALWGDVDHETQAHGLATTGGIVGRTGVAGLALGGGIGFLMREHGLAVDNLLAAELVTAEGSVLRAPPMNTRICSGRCAAVAATSVSSPRSGSPCAPRSARAGRCHCREEAARVSPSRLARARFAAREAS